MKTDSLKSVSRKVDSVLGLPAGAAPNLTKDATVDRKFMPISTRKKGRQLAASLS
ncbi:MAG: hypothetical protein KJ960_14650 [Gammaproteobacteria bacterium]|nr:hypothetical protein [Gammaproteobacteria bacterium]